MENKNREKKQESWSERFDKKFEDYFNELKDFYRQQIEQAEARGIGLGKLLLDFPMHEALVREAHEAGKAEGKAEGRKERDEEIRKWAEENIQASIRGMGKPKVLDIQREAQIQVLDDGLLTFLAGEKEL